MDSEAAENIISKKNMGGSDLSENLLRNKGAFFPDPSVENCRKDRLSVYNEGHQEKCIKKLKEGHAMSCGSDTAVFFRDLPAAAQEELLSCLFNGSFDPIFLSHSSGRIQEVNAAAENILGYSPDEFSSMDLTEVFLTPTPGKIPLSANDSEKGTARTLSGILRRKNGSTFSAELICFPLMAGKKTMMLCTARDRTGQKFTSEKEGENAFRDGLTGLYNRAYFDEEVKRLDCDRQLPLSVILGDLNALSLANEAFGRQAGDALLKAAAKVLRKICRSSDLLVRWNDDQFVLLLPHTGQEVAQAIAGRIEEAFRSVEVRDIPVPASISLGYAAKTHRWQDFTNTLKGAEEAMRERKDEVSAGIRKSMLQKLLETLHETTPESPEHNSAMGENARLLGVELGLSGEELASLDLAVTLHDIGKITVSPILLAKTTPVTEEEWAQLKNHAEAGSRIARASTGRAAEVAEVIGAHHERWDGKGYPSALSEENIPLSGRILALVDAWDVMVRGTPYREARTPQEASEIIAEESGKQFDPRLAELFLTKVLPRSGASENLQAPDS